MKSMTAGLALAILAGVSGLGEAQQQPKKKKVLLPPDSVYNVPVKALDGQPADLKDYAGQVALIVNVASRCGNTPQYAGLEKMYGELKEKGFVVLAFPSNDFGAQEPGTPAEIKEFCSSKYSVTFPMFEKVVTKAGGEQSPVYAHLGKFGKALPEWNFGKYLVNRAGQVVKYYKAGTKPDDATLRADIDAALKQK
jgi:glutathione peroxidase